jgi:hypothetical protein
MTMEGAGVELQRRQGTKVRLELVPWRLGGEAFRD